MGIGETGVGQMGVGKTGPNRNEIIQANSVIQLR